MQKNRLMRLASFLSGVALASALTAAHAQTTTNLLSETTFDPAAASPWGYGYFYGNNGLGLQEYNREYYLPEDVDMTNAMFQFSFDITDLAGTTGYGTGFGGPLFLTTTDPASFVSTNREDYIFTFDARAEGLEPGQTANSEMQVQFYHPDENGVAVKSLQVNLPFQATDQWKTFSFTLDQGALGDNTSDTVFAQFAGSTTEVRFNVNLHEPDHSFGFDAGNAVYLDNAKLEVIDRPDVAPVPTVGVALADWNFDDKTVDYEYHYDWSQNDVHAVITGGNNAGGNDPNTRGKDGTSGWFLSLDNTEFANNPPQWAGGGTGGSGPVDYTRFDSANLADYRITFDARVEGLDPSRVNSAAVLQLFFDAPDDTIQPADEDTNADGIVQLNFPIAQVSGDWQTYSFPFNKGSVGGGNKTNFTAFFNQINALRTQWQIENVASLTDWGYDADNALVIDNVKIERLYAGLGTIAVSKNGSDLVLTWTEAPGVKLQSATTVNGPYNDVTDAASGYTVPTADQHRFFRLVQEPTL